MNKDGDDKNIVAIGRRGPKPALKTEKKRQEFEKTPLMSYLAAEARSRGDTPTDLAKHLGIGYVYLTQLLGGKKDTAKLGRDILVAAAKYLDVPVTEAYLYAGALKPTDFVHEGKFERLSGDVFDVMSRHPEWGGFMPEKEEWDRMSQRAKLAYILMFEQVTGEKIIDDTMKTMVPGDK